MQTRNLVGSDWISAADGAEIEVRNPANDALIAKVPRGGTAEARAAIAEADRALPEWRDRPAEERAAPISRLAALMLERSDELGRILTTEQGKPLKEAQSEVAYAASFASWAAEEAKRIYGEIVPASQAKKRILVLRQPVGVTAAITPWNFPAAMILRKLGPALAAGCTMVVKPASQTPLTALAIGELALEAGIPAGVVNIVTGDSKAIGVELLSNPTVRKLSFTGSTETGKKLMALAARNVTRLSLELGGHAPFIVFDDADVDAAVKGAIASKYRNAGQTCVCANRFFVQRGVYEEFALKLRLAVERLKVGSGLDAGTEIGPLIDDAAVEKVQAHVDDAISKGAKLATGGRLAELGSGYSKRFYLPTVLDGFTSEMLLSHEETFGPVSPLRAFEHEDEAVTLANDSRYGLAAYFYTRDASRLLRVAERLDYGIVGANDGSPSTAQAPFGGIKESGFGREGGRYAMHEYLNIKYVSVGL
jgi:succinate-semialdehyde dehydrogenase/glutarate-semialdehyde dehydrogenase